MNGVGLYELGQYEKEIQKAGGIFTQEAYKRIMENIRERFVSETASGTISKDELDFFDCQLYGYECPICRKKPVEYVKEFTVAGGQPVGEIKQFRMDCDCEQNAPRLRKDQKDLKDRITMSKIPEKYIHVEWADWDTGVHQELTEQFMRVKYYSENQGLSELLGKLGICLYGHNGRGKTMAGVCLLKAIILNTKMRCRFVPMADHASNILNSGKDQKSNYEKELEKYDCLYLDDLDKLSTQSKWVQERVFSLIDRMYREEKLLIISTNQTKIADIAKFAGEAGAAVASRLVENMVYARFMEGDDYRASKK